MGLPGRHSKAFDAVDQGYVLRGLATRQVRPYVVSAHLRELVQTEVRIEIPGFSDTSDPLRMTRGIRQGSTLSPMLWA
eukprot:132501-Alexandrium_andersonii.AAC.1